MRKVIQSLALTALTACSNPSETLSDGKRDEKVIIPILSSPPTINELIGVAQDSTAIDGRLDGEFGQRSLLIQCRSKPNLNVFLKSIIQQQSADLKFDNNRPPLPDDDSAKAVAPANGLKKFLIKSGCMEYHQIVAVDHILAWQPYKLPQYINSERWVAFVEKGRTQDGFLLIRTNTID
jgi:hypothetical protein